MIETLRLKNVVIFVQTILSFVLSRKIIDNGGICDSSSKAYNKRSKHATIFYLFIFLLTSF